MLRRSLAEYTFRTLAEMIGVHPSYVNDVAKGKREPGPAILEYYGLEKMPTTYRKAD